MTTQADAHHHSPQLIPRRLLRGGQVHHPAVLDEARRRSNNLQLREIHLLTQELHRRYIGPASGAGNSGSSG